jgi:hypothetical protein
MSCPGTPNQDASDPHAAEALNVLSNCHSHGEHGHDHTDDDCSHRCVDCPNLAQEQLKLASGDLMELTLKEVFGL